MDVYDNKGRGHALMLWFVTREKAAADETPPTVATTLHPVYYC